MNYRISLLALILMAALSFSFSQKDKNKFSIIGKWQAMDEKGELMTYTFKEKGQYEMEKNKEVLKTSKTMEFTYKLDMGQSPPWIDFVIKDIKENGKSLTMLGIIEIIDNENIKINIGGQERPVDFFGKHVIVLQKNSKK